VASAAILERRPRSVQTGSLEWMDGPHLGVVLPNYGRAFDPERLASAAVAAEEAGLDSGWLTDHVLPPARHAGAYGTVAEALVAVGFLAGRTGRLRLGVSALVVPLREPLLTLKQLVSLDVLSGGRLITAVAAGWMEEEFATLGASFPDRGRRLDHWLDLAGSLLRQAPGPVADDGPIPVADAWLAPGPTRPEGLELWVAGVSSHTLRRAAKTGVWHPVGLAPAEFRSMTRTFRAEVPEGRVILRLGVRLEERIEEAATDERGRHAVAGPGPWAAEQLNDYVEAGADGFVVNLDHQAPGLEDRIRRFAAEVQPLLLDPSRR
jgi:alkanesulfonate monooxygenase SsuD/methylene tetrahydromethanopterin reductase-like flavin-dependent oxidoreductase (luciferase family)